MQNLENNWIHFYKYDEGFDNAPAVMVYEPFVNEDKTLYKMHYNNINDYFYNERYTDDLVQFYFTREVDFLNRLKDKPYAPEVTNIDFENKEIIFKWYDSNLNRIMHEGNLDERLPNWKEQIKNIVNDLESQGIYKINLYPHTFYIDSNNNIRLYDLYGCVDIEEPRVEHRILDPIVTEANKQRFMLEDDQEWIDMLIVYRYSKQNNAGKWPENFLND